VIHEPPSFLYAGDASMMQLYVVGLRQFGSALQQMPR